MPDLDTTMVSVPLRLLKMVEWKWAGGSMQQCPACGESYKYGHRYDCKLALAIKTVDNDVRIQKENA
jgi:hypothetical protein